MAELATMSGNVGYVGSISAAWQAADNVALSGLEGIAAGWVTATGRRHRPRRQNNRAIWRNSTIPSLVLQRPSDQYLSGNGHIAGTRTYPLGELPVRLAASPHRPKDFHGARLWLAGRAALVSTA